MVIRCPYRNYESDLEGFKQLWEPWRFRFYTVRMLEYPVYRGMFNYYEGFRHEANTQYSRPGLCLGDRGRGVEVGF